MSMCLKFFYSYILVIRKLILCMRCIDSKTNESLDFKNKQKSLIEKIFKVEDLEALWYKI